MSHMAYAIHRAQMGVVAAREAKKETRNMWGWGLYEGDELKPFEGRPGAMDAFALPSRRGDCLHWADGSVTDIHNCPVVPVEPVVTFPSFAELAKGMSHAGTT